MPHWQRNWSPVEPLSLKYSTLISWVHKCWSAQFEKLAIQVPKLIRLEKYSNYDFGRHLNVDGLAVLDTHSGCHKSLVSIPSLVCNSIWRKKKKGMSIKERSMLTTRLIKVETGNLKHESIMKQIIQCSTTNLVKGKTS